MASLKPITQFLFFSETKASSEIENNLNKLFIKDIQPQKVRKLGNGYIYQLQDTLVSSKDSYLVNINSV